jgi:hypothetical protein
MVLFTRRDPYLAAMEAELSKLDLPLMPKGSYKDVWAAESKSLVREQWQTNPILAEAQLPFSNTVDLIVKHMGEIRLGKNFDPLRAPDFLRQTPLTNIPSATPITHSYCQWANTPIGSIDREFRLFAVASMWEWYRMQSYRSKFLKSQGGHLCLQLNDILVESVKKSRRLSDKDGHQYAPWWDKITV